MRKLTIRSLRTKSIHIILTNLLSYMSKWALISHSTIPFFKIDTSLERMLIFTVWNITNSLISHIITKEILMGNLLMAIITIIAIFTDIISVVLARKNSRKIMKVLARRIGADWVKKHFANSVFGSTEGDFRLKGILFMDDLDYVIEVLLFRFRELHWEGWRGECRWDYEVGVYDEIW